MKKPLAPKRYEVRFIDLDNMEKGKRKPVAIPDATLQLPSDEFPEDCTTITLGRRGKFRVGEVNKVYGVKGLLRVEVQVSKRSGAARARERLGNMTHAERVKEGIE